MNIGNVSIDALQQYIIKIATKVAKNESFNAVVTGTIEESHAGYYTVKLANSSSSDLVFGWSLPGSTASFKKDDYIYLIQAPISSGDLQDVKYFVFGLVSDTQEEFLNLTDWERFQATGGKIDVADANDSSITSFNYEKFGLTKIITIEDSTLVQNINQQGAFAITGYFTCLNADPNVKDYGLQVDFLNKETQVEGASFRLNTGYFSGQSFNMDNLFQHRIVLLDNEYIFDSVKISLWAEAKDAETAWVNNTKFFVSDITLQAGSLIDVTANLSVKVNAEEGKNYFYKINENAAAVTDIVTLNAEPYYNTKLLSASSIQYYWLIKDDSVVEGNKDYLSFVGAGWRCLNDSSDVAAIGTTGLIRVWDNKKNSISFDKSSDNFSEIFTKYSNSLKCAIKYQGAVAISDEFEVFNFAKEDFEINIDEDVEPRILFLESDRITLTAEIVSKNKYADVNDYTIKYCWFKEVGDTKIPLTTEKNDKNETVPLYSSIEEANILIVKDNNQAVSGREYELTDEEIEGVKFFCKAQIYKGNTLISSEPEISNSLDVVSKVAVAAELQQPTYYKYYISKSDGVLFSKKSETGEDKGWKGDWKIEDPIEEEEKEEWKTEIKDKKGNNLIDNDAFDYLNNRDNKDKDKLCLQNGEYLYYTYQTKWYEQKPGDDDIKELKTENWAVPRLLRGVLDTGIELPFETIDKINTFNDLTGGGQEQGIYLEDVYEKTEDTKPQQKKTYYYINGIGTDGKPIYIEFSGTDFEENKVYYERNEDGKKKLYINAEYIKTGTLLVGDNKGNAKFYADINSKDVKIAGFTVNEKTLASGSGKVGINSDNTSDTNVAFWAGSTDKDNAPFRVDYNGTLHSTAIEVIGQNLKDEKKAREEAIQKVIDKNIKDLQSQIDREITSWFQEGYPKPNKDGDPLEGVITSDSPADQWTDNDSKIKHEGDLYYDTLTGGAYRWIRERNDIENWYWSAIADESITAALAAAQTAQGTADKKRQIFYIESFEISKLPQDYDINDILIVGSLAEKAGDSEGTPDTQIYICTTKKGKDDEKSLKDWTKATNMVTKSELDEAQLLIDTLKKNFEALERQVDEKIEIFYGEDPQKEDWGENHQDDIWYDDEGNCWVWEKENEKWSWKKIEDPNLTQAISDIKNNSAALDKVVTIYTGENPPETDFKEGDLWIPGPGAGNKSKIAKENNQTQKIEWVDLDDSATKSELNDIQKIINEVKNESLVFKANYFTDEDENTIPYIILKAKNVRINDETDENGDPVYHEEIGTIFMDTNDLIINSESFKLNYYGNSFVEGAFEINTEPIKIIRSLTDNGLAYDLEINTVPLQLFQTEYDPENGQGIYKLIIDTNNFKLREDGDVEVIGKITATELDVTDAVIKGLEVDKLSSLSADLGDINAGGTISSVAKYIQEEVKEDYFLTQSSTPDLKSNQYLDNIDWTAHSEIGGSSGIVEGFELDPFSDQISLPSDPMGEDRTLSDEDIIISVSRIEYCMHKKYFTYSGKEVLFSFDPSFDYKILSISTTADRSEIQYGDDINVDIEFDNIKLIIECNEYLTEGEIEDIKEYFKGSTGDWCLAVITMQIKNYRTIIPEQEIPYMRMDFSNQPSIKTQNFNLDHTGQVIAQNVILKGSVTATSGKIGGLTIGTDGSLSSKNLKIVNQKDYWGENYTSLIFTNDEGQEQTKISNDNIISSFLQSNTAQIKKECDIGSISLNKISISDTYTPSSTGTSYSLTSSGSIVYGTKDFGFGFFFFNPSALVGKSFPLYLKVSSLSTALSYLYPKGVLIEIYYYSDSDKKYVKFSGDTKIKIKMSYNWGNESDQKEKTKRTETIDSKGLTLILDDQVGIKNFKITQIQIDDEEEKSITTDKNSDVDTYINIESEVSVLDVPPYLKIASFLKGKTVFSQYFGK